MINFIIYETENAQLPITKNFIEQYAIQNYASIKITSASSILDLVKLQGNICLIDYDTYLKNFQILKEWKENNKIIFIFITENYFQMIEAIKEDLSSYSLLSPIKLDILGLLLDYIRMHIKSHTITIKKGRSGEEVIEINKLNYINITDRCLRFHMTCGRKIDSQTLRQSFAKEIKPMLKHAELYFMAPSLLINLENVKELYPDHIIFKNKGTAYYPKTQYEKLRAAWLEFHQV